MTWSHAAYRGFLLAATSQKDHAGVRASDGLCLASSEKFREFVGHYLQQNMAERASTLQHIASQLHPAVPTDNALPARAKALLASEVHRDLGQAWLSEAPAVRASFRASPSLVAALRQLASLRTYQTHRHALDASELSELQSPCQR